MHIVKLRPVTHLLLAVFLAAPNVTRGENWPQFRGPGGRGVAASDKTPPTEIGPETNVRWRVALAEGNSSPVIFGDRIYLTMLRDKRLLTVALARDSGSRLWEAEAPYEKLESVHRVGSPATASVAADGKHVVSFFGSCGLFVYDTQGNQIWHRPLGPFQNSHGATASPVLAGDKVILLEDHDAGSFLAAFDAATGEQVWRTERPDFGRNYATPCVWENDGQTQIVATGSGRIVGYDLQTGEQVWILRGAARVQDSTPVVGEDGKLYVSTAGGGDAPPQPAFEDVLASVDANQDGLLASVELPRGLVRTRFSQFDRDRNGTLDRDEYGLTRKILEHLRTAALAIEPGGDGDITDTHIAWAYERSIPRTPSPLVYRGRFYMIKDGGILTCLDAATGKPAKQGRLRGTGRYFSSPVASGGVIYFCDDRGNISIVADGDPWRQIGLAQLESPIIASPAIADGRLYVRTNEHLYCFGE